MEICELDTKKIQIDVLRAIIEDSSKLPIKDLQFYVKKFELKFHKVPKKKSKDGLEMVSVHYDIYKEPNSNYHEVSGIMHTHFLVFDRVFKVEVNADATAEYQDSSYNDALKSYLYSYMASLIENSDVISKYRRIKLPDYISSFQKDYIVRYMVTSEQYSFINHTERTKIRRISYNDKIENCMNY